jgi:hypothetical protein
MNFSARYVTVALMKKFYTRHDLNILRVLAPQAFFLSLQFFSAAERWAAAVRAYTIASKRDFRRMGN